MASQAPLRYGLIILHIDTKPVRLAMSYVTALSYNLARFVNDTITILHNLTLGTLSRPNAKT